MRGIAIWTIRTLFRSFILASGIFFGFTFGFLTYDAYLNNQSTEKIFGSSANLLFCTEYRAYETDYPNRTRVICLTQKRWEFFEESGIDPVYLLSGNNEKLLCCNRNGREYFYNVLLDEFVLKYANQEIWLINI